MTVNYIEAPEYIIAMLKKECSLENRKLDLQKLDPETKLTAYGTLWSKKRVVFKTERPVNVFHILCERYPKEKMEYFFYNYDVFGDTMRAFNENGFEITDSEYCEMLEKQTKLMNKCDEDYFEEKDYDYGDAVLYEDDNIVITVWKKI